MEKEVIDAITYACEMMAIGEFSKANDKLCEILGVNYNEFEFYYEKEDDEK